MYRDIAFALRQLRTNLRFSLIVVLTLALGIGATTAIFSVVSGVLLRALPFPDSERLVSLQTMVYPHAEAEGKEASDGTVDDVSFPDFFDWRQQSQTLEAVASYAYGTTRKFTPAGNETSSRRSTCRRIFFECSAWRRCWGVRLRWTMKRTKAVRLF